MGRPPKPAAQRRREGNAGKRPINEAWSARGVGPAPDYLSDDALAFWNDHVRELDQLGVLDVADRPVMVTYAFAWQRFMVSTRELETGWYTRGSMGQPRVSAMLQEQSNAARDLLKIATEYGATAAARSRIDREKAGGPRDPFADLPENPRLRAIEGGAGA